MRKFIESVAVGLPLFVFVWFVLPSLKPYVDKALAAASGVSLAIVFVKRLRILVRCEECGKIHDQRFADAGKKTVGCGDACKNNSDHRVYIPRVTIPELVKHSTQRLLGKSPEEIAFRGAVVAT